MEITKAMRVLTDAEKRREYEAARERYLFKVAQGDITEEEEPATESEIKSKSYYADGDNEYWTEEKVRVFLAVTFTVLVFGSTAVVAIAGARGVEHPK